MKAIILVKLLTIRTVSLLMLVSCNENTPKQAESTVEEVTTSVSDEEKVVNTQYIVILKDAEISPAISYTNRLLTDEGGKSQFRKKKSTLVINQLNDFLISNEIDTEKVITYYTAVISGFAITLTDEEYIRLLKSNKIASLEYDMDEPLLDFKLERVDNNDGRVQITPYGVTRAIRSKKVTGYRWIDIDHLDLNVTNTPSKLFAGGLLENCLGHGRSVTNLYQLVCVNVA
jgi:hypothetical protein